MDIERELAQHNNATLRAIEAGRVELAERRLEAYVNFAQAFLDAAGKRGLKFSLETTRSVSLLDWRTPSEIINYAWDGILAAVKSGNNDLMLAATHMPIRFMKMSIEKGDFLFYRKMSQIYPAILATSYVANLTLNKELLVDRAWRYLLEFADFILPKLTAAHDQNTREQFVSEIIWRFGDLMKVALDHNDPSTFAAIGTAMNSLFHNLEIHGFSKDNASSLEGFAAQEKSLVWFGFGSWILRSFVSKDTSREPGSPNPRLVDPSQIVTFFEIVSKQFNNIRQLAGDYQRALDREHGLSPWEGWIMETLPEREVHTIDFDRWITYFYVTMGLRLSKTGNPTTSDIPTPFRDLEFRMNEIREDLATMKAAQDKWASLIPKLAAEPTSENVENPYWKYFLSVNETAVKEGVIAKEDKIIASPMDPQRVTKFQEECVKGWNDQSWLVTVLRNTVPVIEKLAEAGSTYWAVDVLVPKEAFIATSDTVYVGLGRDQGATLARDISTRFRSLIAGGAVIAEDANTGSIVERTLKVMSSLSSEESSVATLVVGDLDLQRQFLAASGFSAQWTQKNPRFNFHEYLGDLDNLPVFFIYDERSSEVLVVDLKKLGKLIVYSPLENNVGGLLVRVTEIDEAEASRVVDNQPKFLQGADGSTLTRSTAIRNLRLKVRIFVGVKIELQVESSASVKKVPI